MSDKIPRCPLMSAGSDIPVVCIQEDCAWYLKSYKACSIYLLGYDSAINIKNKQQKQ